MSSLQEQLLKAGLVDEKKLARAKQEKHRHASLTRKTKGKKQGSQNPANRQAQDRKAERDRELNQKRQEEARRKELVAQAMNLIDTNAIDRSRGELPYSFVYRRKVKKIYVTEEQKAQLAAGRVAIVTCVRADGRQFYLVPGAVAQKIAERDESFVVAVDRPQKAAVEEDDAYADYKVPDDLIW